MFAWGTTSPKSTATSATSASSLDSKAAAIGKKRSNSCIFKLASLRCAGWVLIRVKVIDDYRVCQELGMSAGKSVRAAGMRRKY